MNIRKATIEDYDLVWDIFSEVIQAGDTYVFAEDTPKSDLDKHWFASYMQTYVAEENDEILGTYIIKPNHPDRGNHVANASYMVKPSAQGKGVGKLLCKHSLEVAKESGYQSMQFNIVISTNKAAVHLWQKFGFKIIGTTPKGFNHKELGLVDTHIMWRELE